MKLRHVVVLSAFALTVACGDSPSECDTDLAAPELQNLALSIQAWDTTPGSSAGAFTFDPANPDAPFVAFGTIDGSHKYPNIEFKPRVDADVISPIDGIVVALDEQEPNNYEIHLRTDSDSCYLIGLDHVSNPTVAVGDTVTAGQVLGNPGDWSAFAGQFELQINDDANETYVCPLDLIASGQQAAVEASMTQLMADWEDVKNDTSIFDEGSMLVPGCLVSTMTD